MAERLSIDGVFAQMAATSSANIDMGEIHTSEGLRSGFGGTDGSNTNTEEVDIEVMLVPSRDTMNAVHGRDDELVTLNRDVEPWVGSFPGLGTVHVASDGSFEVSVVEDGAGAEDVARRRRALTHGWAEPLSLARRGFVMINGAALVPPAADGAGCLVVRGEHSELSRTAIALAQRGWSVLADRVTPATWEGQHLVAHPTSAPIVGHTRLAGLHGVGGDRVRVDSNVTTLNLARCAVGQPVVAHVSVGFRRPKEQHLSVLSGHARFNATSVMLAGGVLSHHDSTLAPADRAKEAMAEQMRFASLPSADVRLDEDSAEALEALMIWWESVPRVVGVTSEENVK